jgi:UDP-glucose 4-epimerase
MKIIVTGGCGFIGSHLVDKLIKLDYEVIVIDILKKNINPKAKYIIADINNIKETESSYKNVDCVFHLAAEVQIQSSLEDPLKTFKTNLMGIQAVLTNMKKHKVPKIIFSSSSAVYNESTNPIKETDLLNPLNPYALSKKMGEELCLMYQQLYNIEAVILRYFNVYGPRQNDKSSYSGVISLFLKQLKNNDWLFITGDGKQKRDFVYVDDVVDANIAAMHYKNRENQQIFNIATGESISILDLAKNFSNNITFVKERKGEIKNSYADISLAKNLLEWEPKTRKIKQW